MAEKDQWHLPNVWSIIEVNGKSTLLSAEHALYKFLGIRDWHKLPASQFENRININGYKQMFMDGVLQKRTIQKKFQVNYLRLPRVWQIVPKQAILL